MWGGPIAPYASWVIDQYYHVVVDFHFLLMTHDDCLEDSCASGKCAIFVGLNHGS